LSLREVDGPARRQMRQFPKPPAELDLSIVDAAGVMRRQLHNLIAGRSAVSPEMAYRLERALGGAADAWLRLQAKYDLARVRARAASINVSRLGPEAA
jgi:antitoxin HigA-1